MIRFFLKVALAALIANAAWQLGSAYATFYRFREAVTEASRFSATKSEETLRRRVLELASQFGVPVSDDEFSIRREDGHTYIDGSYSQRIELVPGYPHQWSFAWNIDTSAATLAKPTP
jgi:hypothetical protein